MNDIRKRHLERMMRDYLYYIEIKSQAPVYLTLVNHMAVDLQGSGDIKSDLLEAFLTEIKEFEKFKSESKAARIERVEIDNKKEASNDN